MKNTLKIDIEKNLIIMDRTFAAKVKDTYSEEYRKLQEVKKENPDCRVIVRTIKKNPNKEVYKGLTYGYMEEYILGHGTDEEIRENLAEYRDLRLIAKCHGRGYGYPVIKRWFLARYPEIEDFRVAS